MTKIPMIIMSLLFFNFSAFSLDDAAAMKILKSGRCTTCHDLKRDKIGPSYINVAKRYANPDKKTKAYLKGQSARDYLIHKVRVGTKKHNKNWIKSAKGRRFGIMSKNSPSKISDKDLKAVIEYILSLK